MPRLNLAPACTAAVLLAALTLTTSANAELITWTNAGGDGLWSNAANWNLGRQPNSADAVIINTPGSEQVLVKIGAACNSLVSSHQVQIQAGGNLTVWETASFNGGLSMFAAGAQPFLTNHGTITVSGALSLFDGFVMQDADAAFTMKSGCTTNVWSHFTFVRGSVLNHGSMHIKAPLSVTSFASTETVSFVNHEDGWMYFELPSAGLESASISGASSFINYGKCSIDAGGFIHPKLATYNLGTIYQFGGDFTIGNFQSVDAEGTLLEGTYSLLNGARIVQSTSSIRTIGLGAVVALSGKNAQGASSFLDGINAAESILGKLYVDYGAELILSPAFFGTLENHGIIGVGPGSKVTVNGGYVCHADGTHQIAVSDLTANGIGVFQTYSSMQLDGTLHVDFYDETLTSLPGQHFVVANLVDPRAGSIGGTFAETVVFPTGGNPTHVDYGNGVVELVTGAGCVADLDGSGSVDAADLAMVLGSWGGPGASDFDQSGTTDGADLATLLGAWGTCE